MDINEVRDRLSLHLFFTEEGSTAEVMEEDLRALLSDHARLQAMSVKCKRSVKESLTVDLEQFREAVDMLKSNATACKRDGYDWAEGELAKADRLLALIDGQKDDCA